MPPPICINCCTAVKFVVPQIGGERRYTCLKCEAPLEAAELSKSDEMILLAAVESARQILADYLQPIPRDSVSVLDRLALVLGNPDVAIALARINRLGAPP